MVFPITAIVYRKTEGHWGQGLRGALRSQVYVVSCSPFFPRAASHIHSALSGAHLFELC
jgi:hypothetical protein